MAKRDAKIRVRALRDSQLDRVLRGITKDATRASKEVAGAEAAKARETQLLQKETAAVTRETIDRAKQAQIDKTRTVEALAREELRAEKRATREALREKQRAARESVRLAEREARARMQAERRAAREAINLAKQNSRERRRLALGVAGGAVVGLATGAHQLVERGQALAGVKSRDEMLAVATDFKATLIRTANEAGVSAERRKEVEGKLLKAHEDYAVDLQELTRGLSEGQIRFDQFEKFAGIISDIAKVSIAKDINPGDLIGAMGTLNEQFNLQTPEQQREALDLLLSTSSRGSVDPGDVARAFAPKVGTFAVSAGRTGIEGVREFFGLAQMIATQQAGAAESATMLERLVQRIKMEKFQKQILTNSGIDVTDESGKLRNFGDLAAEFATNDRFIEGIQKGKIFKGQIEAANAVMAIISKMRKDPEAFAKIRDIEAGTGQAEVDRTMEDLRAEPTFRLREIGARAQAATVRDADRIVEAMRPAVEELTDLQTEFPLLTEALGVLTTTIQWAVGAIIANKVMGGVSRVGAGAAAANAVGAAGAAAQAGRFSKLSKAFGKLPVLGAVAGIGTAYYDDFKGLYDGVSEHGIGYLGDVARNDARWIKSMIGMGEPEPATVEQPTVRVDTTPTRPMQVEMSDASMRPVVDALKHGSRGHVTITVEDGRTEVSGVRSDGGMELTVDNGMRPGG